MFLKNRELIDMVMFYFFNFSLELIFSWEGKFQTEVERREHYHFHQLQIQLRNVLKLAREIMFINVLAVKDRYYIQPHVWHCR